MMLKAGDRIINKIRTDDNLPNGNGRGIIRMADLNNYYFIDWEDHKSSWTPKNVVELDIQGIRNDRLNELGI